jgi:tetratricopeptide (TPR) repeat protein
VGDGLIRLRSARAIEPRALGSPPVSAALETRLRSLIPAAIRTRLDAGQTEWLGELRRLSVLFVNLPPTDSERDDALERAQAIVREVQAGLYHHEASLNKLSVDEKGTTAVAALGLPPLSHRDDPRRAVDAALEIHERLRAIGVECSIGVASGRVYCGEIGNAKRREYTIIGRVVNLAARLMQAAHVDGSGILCDEETVRHARNCFHFETLPPRMLKNIEGAVALFRPILAIEQCNQHRGIIGREPEKAALLERIEALKAGRGGVVVIEGEPGIGKSQLIDDLMANCDSPNVACHLGSADAIQQSSPYHAWRNVFSSALGEDAGVRLARLNEWLGERFELAPLLNVVLPIEVDETDWTSAIVGQARADTTVDLLLGLLNRAAFEGPTIIVIDDAHWMDSASWALTLRLARVPGQVLLIVATRPKSTVLFDQHEALLPLADSILRLEQLSNDQSLALARQSLGVASLPKEAADLILQKSQGNPLYCGELSRALRDTGWLELDGQDCRIKPGVELSSVGILDSVEGIINDRVDRLSPSEQMTLKVASVIGRLFGLRLLRDVFPIEPERHEVPVHLDSLTKMDLIQPNEPEPELTFLFRHGITRDVVYDLLTFAHRRKLHQEVAHWYERSVDGERPTFYPLLAHHWAMAGEEARAIDYLDKAGEQALKAGAYQEAIDFLGKAVALQARDRGQVTFEPARVARWRYWLGEAHLSLGHLVQSRTNSEEALRLLARPVPSKFRLPMAYLAQLGLQLARRIGRRRHRGRASSPLLLASSAYGLVGQLCYFDQDRVIGVYSALRSLNLAESAGPSAELARALAVMCVASGLVPAHRLAEVYRRLAFEVLERIEDVPARAWVLQLTGMYDLGIGRWDRASESLAEAVAINRWLGNWRQWEESLGELGRLNIDQGRFEQGIAMFREFGEEASRRDHDQAIAWSFHGRSRALVRQGKFDEALVLLEQSQALPREALGTGDLILREGLLAQIHLARQDWPAARKAADEAFALIGSSAPMIAYILDGYVGVAQTYLTLWEVGESGDLRKLALRSIVRLARIARVYPVGRPRAWLCRAKYHWLFNRPRRARWACSNAIKTAQRLEMPYEEALALWQSARLLASDHPERSTRIDQALAIFRRIDAGPLPKEDSTGLDGSAG